MRKLLWVVGLVTFLTACGDDGIYGTWKNTASGVVIKIEEKNIKMPGMGNVAVQKWDVSKDQKEYVAHTPYITLDIEKTKNGIAIMGVEYERE
ncbi:hypothetical protein AVE81_005198 [Salmonella enterica subsp. diarizonae]|nr:hypothetical protein [Salmonella enterica subsp. diarizonae]ECF6072366.1 hypothetical protein [Salmonella enterica subsp. diarizonae]EDW9104182.1 hypothetical protein [Salmonella enterica subsp. diarizonae]